MIACSPWPARPQLDPRRFSSTPIAGMSFCKGPASVIVPAALPAQRELSFLSTK